MEQDVRWLSDDEQAIWRAYLQGVARVDQYLDDDLRKFGIDLGEYEILVRLSEAPQAQLRMSDLAQQANQSRSRLTHTVTRMENDGLVTRSACSDDRRGVWATLTDQGRELLLRAAPSHVAAVRRILIDAAGDDLDALGRVFSTVLAVKDDPA